MPASKAQTQKRRLNKTIGVLLALFALLAGFFFFPFAGMVARSDPSLLYPTASNYNQPHTHIYSR
jgi:hypothetical protein